MPEYLTPGVYLEETSFRTRSIEGVATSTFGMAGQTAYGPVPYRTKTPTSADVVMVPSPTLITSFTEFERAFGGLGEVGSTPDRVNYLGYAARAFFGNGGRRLYVSRVCGFTMTTDATPVIDLDKNFAKAKVGDFGFWRTRWPGAAGNAMSVEVSFQRSKNILFDGALKGVSANATVEIFADPKTANDVKAKPVAGNLKTVKANSDGTYSADGIATGQGACQITVSVVVRWGDRADVYNGLELNPDHPRSIANSLQAGDPIDEFSLIWLDVDRAVKPDKLIEALLVGRQFLSGADVGQALTPEMLDGKEADPDDHTKCATGLHALLDIEDIAIVATPDMVRFGVDENAYKTAADNLIAHCQTLKAYRIGIVDPPKDSSISEVRKFRSQFDSTYTALYYPWVEIVDPTARVDPGAATALLPLPPSGFAAGIYARSDIERGVHKAPANEVVLGITRFTQNVTYDRQSVLNPEGINALRFFEGRANRVWGARTMSSDPEWKYVNVRRLFNFLEHSIDRSTQWAVFEPNNERLWASIRQSIEDFLVTVWRTGALMGTKPEEAFFVRCDRTTMTQNDLDNGRLICLIGVSPTYPAEFVIFRIGQWTADAQN
jgi:uncharacterized protein